MKAVVNRLLCARAPRTSAIAVAVAREAAHLTNSLSPGKVKSLGEFVYFPTFNSSPKSKVNRIHLHHRGFKPPPLGGLFLG